MPRFIRRVAVCSVIATSILAVATVVYLLRGKSPASDVPDVGTSVFNLLAGGLACGVMFALYLTLSESWDDAWEGKGTFAIPRNIRLTFMRMGGILWLFIGGGALLSAVVEIVREVNLHALLGIWHTAPFCEAMHSADNHVLCPPKIPVLSWILNAPAFVVYIVLGAYSLRLGVRRLRVELE